MTLIEIENNLPTKNKIDFEDFRRAHPNVSFGIPLDPAYLFATFDVTTYELTPKPDDSTAEKYFKFVEVPVLREDKSALQTWVQAPMDKDEKLVAYQAKVDEVTTRRNDMLAASDWTQLPDVKIDAAIKESWAVYRQALRDISKQSGYPWMITWPTLTAPT